MATNLVQLQHMLDEIKVEMVSWSKLDGAFYIMLVNHSRFEGTKQC